MSKKTNDDWDADSNQVQSNFAKFNVSADDDIENPDKIIGTLIAKRQVKSTLPGKEGELTWVYDLKADAGSLHALDEKKKLIPEPIVVNEGEFWSVGGKPGIDAQMRNIKIGQKVGFKFIDEKPSQTKGFAAAKNIKVYAPKNDDGTSKMDEEWLAANETSDGFGN